MRQLTFNRSIQAIREARVCKICRQPLSTTRFYYNVYPEKKFHFIPMCSLYTAECKDCQVDYAQFDQKWLTTFYTENDLHARIPIDLVGDIIKVHEEAYMIDHVALKIFLAQHQEDDQLFICHYKDCFIGFIFVRGEHLLNAVEFPMRVSAAE